MIFAFVYSVLTAVVMLFFHMDYVVIASIVAGLCMLIPLIGNYLAFIPTMLVVIVTPSLAGSWWLVLLGLFITQSFMLNVIGPRIMSAR